MIGRWGISERRRSSCSNLQLPLVVGERNICKWPLIQLQKHHPRRIPMTVYDWLFDSRIFGIVKLSRGDRICCQPMRNCVVYTIRYTTDAELVFSLLLARESYQKHSIWRCIEMPCHSCDISVINGLITGYFCSVCKDMLLSLQWSHNGRDSVSNHQPHECLLNRLFRRKSKKTSKLRDTGLCAGNSPGTGEFPTQMASYAENVSIWWRHHGRIPFQTGRVCTIVAIIRSNTTRYRLQVTVTKVEHRS